MQPLTSEPFDVVMGRLESPFQAGGWTNAFLNPELRVRCVDCTKPIPYAIERCPFCKALNPDKKEAVISQDVDKDGMNDVWEREHGLNPNDPSDAATDLDNDGFCNLEEYQDRTDPRDPESHPPFEKKLVVDAIVRADFRLLFKSYMKEANGAMVFALNAKDFSRTYFVRMGEMVGEKGEEFVLTNFVQRIETNALLGGVRRDNDLSELTLTRGGRNITVVLNRKADWDECRARLVFAIDGSTYAVKKGDTIEVNKIRLTVKDIDISTFTVVLTRDSDGVTFVLGKGNAAGARASSSEETAKGPPRGQEPAKE